MTVDIPLELYGYRVETYLTTRDLASHSALQNVPRDRIELFRTEVRASMIKLLESMKHVNVDRQDS